CSGSGGPAVAAVAAGVIAGDRGDHAVRGDPANSSYAVVATESGNQQVAAGVHRYAPHNAQLRADGRPAVARQLGRSTGWYANARHRGDGQIRRDLANPAVSVIGDEQVAVVIHRQGGGISQLSVVAWPSVARKARCAIARDGGDDSFGRDSANAIALIDQEQITDVVHEDGVGIDSG